MKNLLNSSLILILMAFGFQTLAQQPTISNFRPYDKNGINIFEAPKTPDVMFDGIKVRVGGSFTQQFQMLEHENSGKVPFDTVLYRGDKVNANELYALAPGFNLATANLNIDAQLADGIRLSLENYMSSRHHSEFWVKGGYIQIDKLPMFNNPEWYTKYMRLRVGHFQVNYGDQQFRRSDNGNTMYNPFVGNYIMDAFTTEIGGEAYVFTPSGLMGMVGATSGYINGNIQEGEYRNPSIYAKLAFDKQVNPDLRFRLSGSMYMNSGVGRNTLFAGDRGGSRYYLVMEPAYYLPRGASSYSAADAGGLFTSGRMSPNLSSEVTTFMINPFLKWKGLEFFGTFEMASGLNYGSDGGPEADKREFTQYGGELIYRFLPNEQLYIGTRYQQVTGPFLGGTDDVSVDRFEVAAGWFPIDNLLLKVAYQQQQYKDFPVEDYRNEGVFNGIVIEAAVGF